MISLIAATFVASLIPLALAWRLNWVAETDRRARIERSALGTQHGVAGRKYRMGRYL